MAQPELGFIHRFVPAAPADSPVTLLLLHGTGGNEQDLLPIGSALWPGAALLSPRGQVHENGMPRFFRRLAEGVFDVDDLKFRTHELAHFVRSAAERYGFQGKSIVAVGYSNGANIGSSLMLLHPDLLSGAILFRPMVPFPIDHTPDLRRVHVLLAPGRRDPIVTHEQVDMLAHMLEAAGADISLSWHEGGHELGQDDLTAARNWLSQQSFTSPDKRRSHGTQRSA
jgi:phospholipase/carboxylesterase/glyoxalase family protein